MVNYIYFWYSLVCLISRTIGVFLSAAAINEASKKPGQFIKSIQSSEWSAEVVHTLIIPHTFGSIKYNLCLQVERFADQINGDIIALSGMKFFYLTRKVLLTV